MKIRIDQHIVRFSTAAAYLLAACNGQLAVVDDLNAPGGDSDGGRLSESTHDGRCTCASSESLQPLGCGSGRDVPLYDDSVQTTTDGAVVAFDLCLPDVPSEVGVIFNCEVFYWSSSAPAHPIASELLLGLSANGEEVLVSGVSAGLLHIGRNGRTTSISLGIAGDVLSADGNTVVGAVYEGNGVELARANVATGEIEVLGQVANMAIARVYLNADASAMVGYAGDESIPSHLGGPSEFWTFRWSEQGLSFGLPGVAEDNGSFPEALSADGSVIAGRNLWNNAHFRWSADDGYVEIASGWGRSATWLSADGSVVVGSLDPDGVNDSSAFRWTTATGPVEIAPGSNTLAVDMSDDGRVVVANSWEDAQLDGALAKETFVWDTVHGTRSLADILRVRHIDATGWQFGQARALSGNGEVLLGRAECGGVPTLYRLVLSGD